MPEPNPDHSFEERVARWKLKMLDKNNNDVSSPGCLQIDAVLKKKIFKKIIELSNFKHIEKLKEYFISDFRKRRSERF